MKKGLHVLFSMGMACCLLACLFISPVPARAALPTLLNLKGYRDNAIDARVTFTSNMDGECIYYLPRYDPFMRPPTQPQMLNPTQDMLRYGVQGLYSIKQGPNTINLPSLSYGNECPLYLVLKDASSGTWSPITSVTIPILDPLSDFGSARTAEDSATVTFKSSVAGSYLYYLSDGLVPTTTTFPSLGTSANMVAGENTLQLGGITSNRAKRFYMMINVGGVDVRYQYPVPAWRMPIPRTGDDFPFAGLLTLMGIIIAASGCLILRERRACLSPVRGSGKAVLGTLFRSIPPRRPGM